MTDHPRTRNLRIAKPPATDLLAGTRGRVCEDGQGFGISVGGEGPPQAGDPFDRHVAQLVEFVRERPDEHGRTVNERPSAGVALEDLKEGVDAGRENLSELACPRGRIDD